jgi:hypothetical protein
MLRHACIAATSLALAVLAACSPPQPPEERRPEPRADATAQAAIVATAAAYKEAARPAVAAGKAGADRRRARIDAAAAP